MGADRTNELRAQRVEVALIYQKMLGDDEARTYLKLAGVPPEVVERVLAGPTGRRPSPSDNLDATNHLLAAPLTQKDAQGPSAA